MSEHSDLNDKDFSIRERLIGVTENSFRKTYYPQLQSQMTYLEEKSLALLNILEDLDEARRKLEESEAKYRSIFENTGTASIIVEDDTTISLVNAEWVVLSGFSQEESYGKSWIEFTAPEDIERMKEYHHKRRLNDPHIPSKYEFRFVNRKGEVRNMLVSVTIIPGTKKSIASLIDITERKQAEETLLESERNLYKKNKEYEALNEELKHANKELFYAKEKAEESDRLKSAFLANMSHEIRTPMNGILGFAELLKTPQLTGEQQQAYISIIEQSGVRMLNIINDIIDISKIESGVMTISIAETNINELVENILNFFKPEAEQKGLSFSLLSKLPSKEANIKTDRDKVYAILANLLKNAIKFTDKGSINIGYYKKDEFIEFYIKDTGIGIPKDRQCAVFERFIQADIGDSRAFQGAGLGLSITKAFVEMIGGKIWFESEEKVGSVFYFTIPYKVENESVNNVKIDIENKTNQVIKKLKILIAEDDETSDIFLTIILEDYNCEILHAKNGIMAVDICRSNPDIDLVLMDIKMPEKDGYEATNQIRQFNEKVIIIAQTAYAMKDDREKAIENGCNDYITKPINQSILSELIQKYFNLNQ